LYIDGDEFEVGAGDVLRIDPAGERCITADEHSSIKFICIQTEANSLVQFTQNDGIPSNAKPSWPGPAAPLLPGPTSGATQWNCTLDAASGNHLDLSTGLEV